MFFKGQTKFFGETDGDQEARSQRARAAGFHCLLSATVILCAAIVSLGQGVNGTLRGVVKDAKGGLVPGAAVTLSSDRGDERQTKTNSEGAYIFTAVAPGKYSLKVEAPNFKTASSDVSIAPSESRTLEIGLEVGAPTENVTITADVTQIKTDTGERSDTLTAKQIDNLSIIGRSGLELLRILPGVVAPDPGDPNSGTDRVTFGAGANATANYTVNGIRGQNNNVSIDGSRVIDIGSNNGTMITPNVDMIQEATIKSSNYAAEYGSGGVQVSFTTKGGGKEFHGELYDYIRPGSLQANDRSSSSQGIARPPTSFQYPGGNIGGPLLLPFKNFNKNRDKLFFFVGFEVQRQKPDRGARFGTVPTQLERNGDFSKSLALNTGQYGNHLCPPDTIGWSDCNGGGGLGADGGARNPVPMGDFRPYKDPLGSALLNLFPLPNFVPGTNSIYAIQGNNYASNFVSPENRTDLKMRFDYKVSNSTNVYVRLARESESDDSPYGIWWGPSAFELPSHVVGTNLGRSAAANITSVLSPTMTNEFVVSGSKLRLDYDYSDPSKVTKSALGVQNIKLPWGNLSQTPYASVALINGWANGQGNMWEPGGLPLFAINDSYSASDTLSKVYNNHTLKFGALVERATKVQNLNSVAEGRFEFEASQARTTGNAFANLYTGRINNVQQSTVVPTGHFKFYDFEGYAQDSWKVRPNVTFEYGVRLALFTNNTETSGLASVFDPNAFVRGAGPYLPGANGQPDLNKPNGFLTFKSGQIPKSVYDSNPGVKISPRLNLAWDISGKGTTVVRGGAGLFYNRVQGNYQYAIQTIAPNQETIGVDSWSNAPNNDLSIGNLGNFNPFNTAAPACRCVEGGISQDRGSNRIPRIMTTSLSVARRLPFQNVLEVAYVGTFGRHLPQRVGLNYLGVPMTSGTFGNANLADPIQRAAIAARGTTFNDPANAAVFANLLPYPVFAADNGGGIQLEEYNGISAYHSLQVTLNRQLGKTFQYFLTYTFSKALGTTSTNETDGDAIVDPIDSRHRSFGILPYDRTHIFNFSYNYNFPNLAKGSLSNPVTHALFDGWQMSGITTFQSGHPIRVKFTGAINNASAIFGNFGDYAIVGSNALSSNGVAPVVSRNAQTGNGNINSLYIDPSAFTIPAVGTSGPYQSPFYLRSPFTNNFDMTFFKNFKISESKKLQFRVGLFNVFNEAFANPDTTPSDLGNYSGGSLTINTLNANDPRFDKLGANNQVIAGSSTTCFQIPIGTHNGIGTVLQNGTARDNRANVDVPVSGVCDPTKGFIMDPNSLSTFGKILNRHGHRRIELALKFYF